MSLKDSLILSAIIVLYILSALFSLLDMAYSSVKISRLELAVEKKERFSKDALKNAKNYDRTIATILFGNDFVNILSSSLVAIFIQDMMHNSGIYDEAIINLVTTIVPLFILLIFCEYTPKAIGRNFSLAVCKIFTYFITTLEYMFYFIVVPVSYFSNKVTSKLVEKTGKEDEVFSDDELIEMVDEIENEGLIDKDKSDLLYKSIQFKETSVYEIMTPRVKIVGYDILTSLDKFIETKDWTKYSRIIVYKGDKDNIVGYFHVKTLLRYLTLNIKYNLKDILLPILSVPSTMLISQALETMKKNRQHILLVKDEYNGTDGIVTMEDILEELVGEMWDENDSPVDSISFGREKNSYRVKGDISIYDFFDFFELNDDELDEDYTTLSGYLTDKLGRFVKQGDKFNIEFLSIKNFIIRNNMIIYCLVYVNKKEDEEDEEYNNRLELYKAKLDDILSNKKESN